MSDTRERVARAVFEASTYYGEWDRQPMLNREVCFKMADAALSALEPAPAPTVAEAAKVLLDAADEGYMPSVAKMAAVKAHVEKYGKAQPIPIIEAWQAALRALAGEAKGGGDNG